MVVGNEHGVDGRQVVKGDRRGDQPTWAGPLNRGRTVAPVRVGQEVQAADLEQKRRVADPGHLDDRRVWRVKAGEVGGDNLRAVRLRRRAGRVNFRGILRPEPQHPAQHVQEPAGRAPIGVLETAAGVLSG